MQLAHGSREAGKRDSDATGQRTGKEMKVQRMEEYSHGDDAVREGGLCSWREGGGIWTERLVGVRVRERGKFGN